MGLIVPGTHPWLSHECPGYSTDVIRVLGHFDTRLSYSTHPQNTSTLCSVQTNGTRWGSTAHSRDGILFATNKLYLEVIKMCITCMTSPHTTRTWLSYHRPCQGFTTFSQRIISYSRKCFFSSSLMDDNSTNIPRATT